MALLRRALVALGMAGIIAAVLRLRGSGGTPPQQGGWRELRLEPDRGMRALVIGRGRGGGEGDPPARRAPEVTQVGVSAAIASARPRWWRARRQGGER